MTRPLLSQERQRLLRQRHLAIFTTFALTHMHYHAFTIDIADLQLHPGRSHENARAQKKGRMKCEIERTISLPDVRRTAFPAPPAMPNPTAIAAPTEPTSPPHSPKATAITHPTPPTPRFRNYPRPQPAVQCPLLSSCDSFGIDLC